MLLLPGLAAGRLRAPRGSCWGSCDGRMVRWVPDMSGKTSVKCHSLISQGPLYGPRVLWVMRVAPLPHDVPSQHVAPDSFHRPCVKGGLG